MIYIFNFLFVVYNKMTMVNFYLTFELSYSTNDALSKLKWYDTKVDGLVPSDFQLNAKNSFLGSVKIDIEGICVSHTHLVFS